MSKRSGWIVRVADEKTFTVKTDDFKYVTVRIQESEISSLKKEFEVEEVKWIHNKRAILDSSNGFVYSERNKKRKGVPCIMHLF